MLSKSKQAELRKSILERHLVGKTRLREALANCGYLARRYVMGEIDYVPTVAAAEVLGLDPESFTRSRCQVLRLRSTEQK